MDVSAIGGSGTAREDEGKNFTSWEHKKEIVADLVSARRFSTWFCIYAMKYI